ncbi:MAG TPA: malectin domain-containing carbohydrate-binding protein [Arachidicoccus sp.]|nr:malectin domain-containing carbohydrate-binding protein [Arachidicoccus sp.]
MVKLKPNRQSSLSIRCGCYEKQHLILWWHHLLVLLCLGISPFGSICGQSPTRDRLPWTAESRTDIVLSQNWKAIADSSGAKTGIGFEKPGFKTTGWKRVSIPHNFDDYGGYRRLKHGNLHGDGWYRKAFAIPAKKHSTESARAIVKEGGNAKTDRYFLFFEGISSYCTVWLNGHKLGGHAGGRTSFTFDATEWLNQAGQPNLLAIKVRHPANIRDLPWVCGGCSDEVGFSEGSQPFGIFRPVHLIRTGSVRIEPFGVHIWNDTTVSARHATLYLGTTFKNYSQSPKQIRLEQILVDKAGKQVSRQESLHRLKPHEQLVIKDQLQLKPGVHLWSLETPYLYQLKTRILDAGTGKLIDDLITPYGIRWIRWPDSSMINGAATTGNRTFLLNGKPVFINGIAGYEHALGKSHAFTGQEIATRTAMIHAMGFNGFRDAHQPHNLRFQYEWDHMGILWWPQFSAHIWFDSPAFRKNFLRLLHDWIIERRNSPSNIMWGLQNESRLPVDFARQCVRLIRDLDPTASSQRLITTCNGGEGTDWDVPQNWTGTYGGDPDTYNKDLKKQLLVGEYGGWRSKDLHTEGGFDPKGPYSENSWTALLEKKIRLAGQIKDSVCGQFLWLFNSHDNPGRVQAAEGYRDLDRIGPVNYKGILTSWEAPTDGFYLYQSNFTDGHKSPMVYIVSHSWPDRWTTPGIKDGIEVYSNCDSVQLYNGLNQRFLGTRVKGELGTHFVWNQVPVCYSVLYAVGFVGGQPVVTDQVRLHHLPEAPEILKAMDQLLKGGKEASLLTPAKGFQYLYRINCGGPAYTDRQGQVWMADRGVDKEAGASSVGSSSWTNDYPGLPAYFASQGRVSDPISGTVDPVLFRTFRYGREKLAYHFPVASGRYRVELYFAEPWWGLGSKLDCKGWRDFDVAINGVVRLAHLDIWKEAGCLHALKKTVDVEVKGDMLTINFPNTYSGQAVIAAIAIARMDPSDTQSTVASKYGEAQNDTQNDDIYLFPAANSSNKARVGFQKAPAQLNLVNRSTHLKIWALRDWLDLGDTVTLLTTDENNRDNVIQQPVSVSSLPPDLFGASYLVYVAGRNKHEEPGKTRVETKSILPPAFTASRDLYIYLAPVGIEAAAVLRKEGYQEMKTAVQTDLGKAVWDTASSSAHRLWRSGKEPVYNLPVYRKSVQKGAKVLLPAAALSGIIAFQPVSQLQPPYDQQPEKDYPATGAEYSADGANTLRMKKQVVGFTKTAANTAFANSFISWPIVTGVAAFHSFQIRYALEGTDSLQAQLRLVSADGTVMDGEPVQLVPTRTGKWNNITLESSSMINAGHYSLELSWKANDQNLYFSTMKLR